MAIRAIPPPPQQLLDQLIDLISSPLSDLDQFKSLLNQLDSNEVNRFHSSTRLSPLETLFSRYPQITELDLDILETLLERGADLNKVDESILRKMMETELEELSEPVKKFEARLIRKFRELDGTADQEDVEMDETQTDVQTCLPTPVSSLVSSSLSSSQSQSPPPTAPDHPVSAIRTAQIDQTISQRQTSASPSASSRSIPRSLPSPFLKEGCPPPILQPSFPLPSGSSSSQRLLRAFISVPLHTSLSYFRQYFTHTIEVSISNIALFVDELPGQAFFDIEENLFRTGDLSRKLRNAEDAGDLFRRFDRVAWRLKVRVAGKFEEEAAERKQEAIRADQRKRSSQTISSDSNPTLARPESPRRSLASTASSSLPSLPRPPTLVRLFVSLPHQTPRSYFIKYFSETLNIPVSNEILLIQANPGHAFFDIEDEIYFSGELERRVRQAEDRGDWFRRSDGLTWKLRPRLATSNRAANDRREVSEEGEREAEGIHRRLSNSSCNSQQPQALLDDARHAQPLSHSRSHPQSRSDKEWIRLGFRGFSTSLGTTQIEQLLHSFLPHYRDLAIFPQGFSVIVKISVEGEELARIAEREGEKLILEGKRVRVTRERDLDSKERFDGEDMRRIDMRESRESEEGRVTEGQGRSRTSRDGSNGCSRSRLDSSKVSSRREEEAYGEPISKRGRNDRSKTIEYDDSPRRKKKRSHSESRGKLGIDAEDDRNNRFEISRDPEEQAVAEEKEQVRSSRRRRKKDKGSTQSSTLKLCRPS